MTIFKAVSNVDSLVFHDLIINFDSVISKLVYEQIRTGSRTDANKIKCGKCTLCACIVVRRRNLTSALNSVLALWDRSVDETWKWQSGSGWLNAGSTLRRVYSKHLKVPVNTSGRRWHKDRHTHTAHAARSGPRLRTEQLHFSSLRNEETSHPDFWLPAHVVGMGVCAVHPGHGLLEDHANRRARRFFYHQGGVVLVQPVEGLFHRFYCCHQL